jgi:hypothetical protein
MMHKLFNFAFFFGDYRRKEKSTFSSKLENSQKRNAATKGAALEPAKNPLKRVLGTPKLSCGAAVRLVQTLKRLRTN